jgi:hypothetical protein
VAVSNRDRVQKGFETLAEGLEPFIDEKMSAAAPTGDWIAMLEARDEQKNGVRKTYDKNDPAVLLRCLTEEWRVFSRSLSRAQQSFASELRDTRNRWAHNDKFSADDTYRALDTMERLLQAVGASEQADAVRQIRIDLGRTSVEAETRKAVAQTDSSVSVAGTAEAQA